MHIKHSILISLVTCFFACACASSSKPVPTPGFEINTYNANSLEGVYKISSENEGPYFFQSLWSIVTPFFRDTVENWLAANVRLKVEGDKIVFELKFDSTTVRKENFKYKLKDGYLLFKNNRLQGIPLIFYRSQNKKIYVTLENNDILLMHVRGSSEGGLFIFIFGSPDDKDYSFKRVSE